MSKKEDTKIKTKTDNLFEKIKEMWKDKRGRAIIKLSLYFLFLVSVIILMRISNNINSKKTLEDPTKDSFINTITDNYKYDLTVEFGDNVYYYTGKVLGNNRQITRKDSDGEVNYSIIDNKYYIQDGENYLSVSEEEIYPYINYRYLDIDNIKGYIKVSTLEDNIYKLPLSYVSLYGSSDKYILVTLSEKDSSVTVDYSELFKETNMNINKVIITYNFSDIGILTSLGDEGQTNSSDTADAGENNNISDTDAERE